MENNKIIKHSIANSSIVLLPDISKIEEFANAVKNSSLADAFKKKNKDGQMVVDIADIVAAVSLGNDMGITPAASLLLGRKLNANSYFSVLRGRELGLNPITSMSKIYVISTTNGDILALDVGLIAKAILDSGTKMEYIRDFEPTFTYKDIITNKYLGHKWLLSNEDGTLNEQYFLYINNVTPQEDVKKANADGKMIIAQTGITNVTSLRLIRNSNNINKIFHYSLQDATDAGLYMGYSSSLLDVKTKKAIYIKGRDNWNKHPVTMLRNRVTSIGGRIIVADLIQGGYSMDEAMELANVDTKDDLNTISINQD